jgi:hypothetical protein
VQALARDAGQWLLLDATGREVARAAHVVLAAAGNTTALLGATRTADVRPFPDRVGLRPEALQPAEDGAAVRVLARRFAGDGHRLTLDLGGVAASLRWRQAAPAAGETVHVRLDPAGAVVFDDAGEPQVSERLP